MGLKLFQGLSSREGGRRIPTDGRYRILAPVEGVRTGLEHNVVHLGGPLDNNALDRTLEVEIDRAFRVDNQLFGGLHTFINSDGHW